MTVHLVGHQTSDSLASLFSLSSSSAPILQITSSLKRLSLDYQPPGAVQKLTSLQFPNKNPFVAEKPLQLAISVEPERVTFFVACQEAVVLKSDERINLSLPRDVVVTLASTPGKQDSKFTVSTANTYLGTMKKGQCVKHTEEQIGANQ